MVANLILLYLALPLAAGDLRAQPSTASEIIARMIAHDRERQAGLDGYAAFRRYVLDSERRNKRAEMLVRMKCLKDGSKEFEIVSSAGWGFARSHVFPRLLSAEADASQPDLREQSRIIPE